MFRDIVKGVVAGCVGTVALNVATYADMAIRGRGSSGAPAQMVDKVADKAGLSASAQKNDEQKQTVENRESGIGALLGYVNGLGVGALYGLLSSQEKPVSMFVAAPVVGFAAMSASDVPLIALRVSNPKEWGLSGWLSDAIPHLIYGFATVLTYRMLDSERGAKRRMRAIEARSAKLQAQVKKNSKQLKRKAQKVFA